ncbi:hypothetical protein HBH77_122660 [Parastagonospora nodorum]|nr:hypothetical protein HBI78_065120 [Parastagonospora nodorum]KAH5202073.1 hypothetical protein HBH77_122660 [Parastagonospora nodorum]
MDSSPDHPGCPKQRSEAQKLTEPASRVRLQILPRRNPRQPRTGPGTREYVDDFRENLATLKENYNRQGQTFDGENITICITVFNLVYRLESLKEHEQDMRPRLVERLEKEEEELAKATRHRDALAERSNNVRDVERQERLLQKQLGNINARTDKLKTKADEEAEHARERMEGP